MNPFRRCDRPIAVGAARPSDELGLPGRLLVAAIVLAGLPVAIPSGFGLLWFIPYASVGGILVMRRPRVAIGWLLLLLGWVHAFAIFQLDVPASDFAGPVPLPEAILGVAMGSAGAFVFFGYAVLAILLPAGRPPTGRSGRWARGLLALGGLGVVLVATAPQLNINLPGYPNGAIVPNPFAVLPALRIWGILSVLDFFVVVGVLVIATGSLLVRARRSRGVERQQLRWIGTAIALVVTAVVAGLVISAIVPGAADSGVAWVPAIAAFTTVPIAIGVAVLRYRLEDGAGKPDLTIRLFGDGAPRDADALGPGLVAVLRELDAPA